MTSVFDTIDIADTIKQQSKHCRKNGAEITARICSSLLALIKQPNKIGQRLKNWSGKPVEDALALRLAGGFHYLNLTGKADELNAVYTGQITDQSEIDSIIMELAAKHEDALLPWFDSPPQTNEAGRSASFMAGLKWLSGKIGPRFELNEIGASAGINSMMDRYLFDLCGVKAGPPESPVKIKPEWRGSPPPDNPVEIISIQGCDQAPIDLCDPEAALRLRSYVWPENHDRMTRMDAALLLAAQKAPDVAKADAADWVECRLTMPQPEGTTRIFNHSIVWQYIPAPQQARITNAIEKAGALATPEEPLAWMSLETNRATFRHELIIRYWNGEPEDGRPHLLAQAQAHGQWIEWF